MHGTRPRRGYTLIEVLLLVVILGIAGALVAPLVTGGDPLRVQSAVRTVIADITFAQSDALAFQQRRAIVFNAETNSYYVAEVNGAEIDPVTDTLYKAEGPGQRYVVSFQRGDFGEAAIASPNFDDDPVLVFDELGGPVRDLVGDAPSAGGSVLITAPQAEFSINVEAYTGRVTVDRIR